MIPEKTLKDLEKKEWRFYVSRKFNWYVESVQILANTISSQKKLLGFSIPTENYLILNGDEYYSDEETQRTYSFFEKRFREDRKFFEIFAQKLYRIVEDVDKYISYLKSIDVSKLDKDKLLQEIDTFNNVYLTSFIPAWTRPDIYLEEIVKKEFPDIFSDLAIPIKTEGLLYSDEPLDLLETAKKAKAGRNIDNDIQAHINQYAWLKGPILHEDISFTRDEFLERINGLLDKDIDYEIERIIQVRKDTIEKAGDILKTHTISDEYKMLIKALQNFIYLRTYTTQASDHLFFVGRHTLLHEAAKRLHITNEEVVTLTGEEITKSLKNGKLGVNNLAERVEAFALIWLEGQVSTYFGKTATELQQHFSAVQPQTNRNTVITGMPASHGKVEGIVKILRSYKEIHKINRGEILVASMTTPDYIMAMEKAAAFITDEGGVTCHAAIVAREFGVPCIVGTGNATKILKDGDCVEVDAIKGIVTIK